MSHPSELVRRASSTIPVHEARHLLAHVLDVSPAQLALGPDVDHVRVAQFEAAVVRRAAGEPLQYITGVAYFRDISVAVGPGVFIPRPETELLVEAALNFLRQREPDQRRVVELCAGSGAAAVSIATELAATEVWAVELSADAWPWLERNAAQASVRCVQADLRHALPQLAGSVDCVVVNPPYVPLLDREWVPADVLDHEPELAIFAGEDGLSLIPDVAAAAARLLKPGGMVGCEHDESHQMQVMRILESGFDQVTGHQDLAGRPRYVTGVRKQMAG